MRDEEQFFSSLVKTTIEAHPKKGDGPGEAYDYEIERFQAEKELVESEGLNYFRLPSMDHCWPEPECVDQFINMIKETGIDNLCLHIHCHAGKSRTGSFLVMYDKMKNPDVPIKEIAIRQAMLGSSYMLNTERNSDGWKAPLYEEKARMTYLFEDYINETKDTNYELPWSEWLEGHELEDAAWEHEISLNESSQQVYVGYTGLPSPAFRKQNSENSNAVKNRKNRKRNRL